LEEVYQQVEILDADGQPRPPEQAPLLRSLRGEIVRGEEIMRHRQTNTTRYRQFSSAPMHDVSGAITGAVAITRDITEQKRAEEGLRRYELLSTNSKDIVLFIRCDDGRILDANSAALQAYGYSHAELLALTIQKLSSRAAQILTEAQMAQADAEGILFETVHQRKDGSTFPVEVSLQGAAIGSVRTQISLVRDITGRKQAEAKQAYLASFPEQNPNPITEVDFDGQVRYANPAAQHSFPDLNIHRLAHAWLSDWDDVTRPFREGQAEVRLREVVVGNYVYQQTFQYIPQERLIRIYGTDITTRRRAEEQMELSNRKLNEILASIQDDFYVLDRDWNFVYANRLFTAKIGKETEDFVGKNIWEMFPKYMDTLFEENFRAAMEKREIRRFEIGGKYTNAWYRMTVFPSADGIAVIGTDITERKQAEEALRESESRFRSFIENAPVAISLGRDGKLIYVNPMYIKMYGFDSANELIGHSTTERVAIQSRDKSTERSQKRAQGLPTEDQYELTGVRKDGTEFPMFASVTRLSLADGPANIGFFQDITERKRAEQAIGRQAMLLDLSYEAIFAWELGGAILSWNKGAEKLYGYSSSEAIGHVSHKLLRTVHHQKFNEIKAALVQNTTWTGELVHISKDGRQIIVASRHQLLQDESGRKIVLETSRDITEQKLAEKALKESEERFRAVVENAMDAIVVADPSGDGRILSANSSACRMFGYGMEEFSGLDRSAILDIHAPNFSAFMEQRERQGQVTTELTYKRKNGARFSGELSSAYYHDKNGDRRAISIIRDVTERKLAAEQLSAALQEKEVLLKEIHHRVKNNLQVISSLLRLQAATLDDSHVRELFAESQRRVRAMALIHEQLYQSSNLARMDFRDYLHNLVNYLRRSYTQANSSVEIRVTVENVVIEMDQAMPLGLLVSELVSNSLKYAFPSIDHTQTGEIWIIARREPQGGFTLIVGDNGVGLPDSLDIEHLPTMGLQLVSSFVAQLLGQFTVQRKPGTIFTIFIPERVI
jgi:PAS domain S-box-containing protein